MKSSLFLSTINRSAKSYLLAILGAEYLLRAVPPGTHEWSKFITPAEIKDAITLCGLHQVSIKGLVPSIVAKGEIDGVTGAAGLLLEQSNRNLLQSWSLSETDVDVNYIVHATRK